MNRKSWIVIVVLLFFLLMNLDQPKKTGDDYSIRVAVIADPHIITSGDCGPSEPEIDKPWGNIVRDGRTSCPAQYLAGFVPGCEDTDAPGETGFGFPDDWGTCPWLTDTGGWIATPTVPNLALSQAAPALQAASPDMIFIAGDIIAVGNPVTDDCGQNSLDSFNYFAQQLAPTGIPYFPVLAQAHDHGDEPLCRRNVLQAITAPGQEWGGITSGYEMFGSYPDASYDGTSTEYYLNYHFIYEDNLFIHLSEAIRWDTENLTNTLETYQNQDMKIFLHFHSPWYAYDGAKGGQTRVYSGSAELLEVLKNYDDGQYKVMVLIAGHTHANQYHYLGYDYENGVARDPEDPYYLNAHQFIVGAVMTYPSQFRVFDITKDRIDSHMSESFSPEVDMVSTLIRQNYDFADKTGWLDETLYGGPDAYDTYDERNVVIDLAPPAAPSGGGGGGGGGGGIRCYTPIYEEDRCSYRRVSTAGTCEADEYDSRNLCEQALEAGPPAPPEEPEQEKEDNNLIIIALVIGVGYILMSQKRKKKKR